MARRPMVILNSRAGGSPGPTARELGELFRAAGLGVTIESATGPEIPELAQRAVSAQIPVVVAAGGDGTVSSAASVLAGSDTVLGIVPLGTLNHFAKTLGIPSGVADAVQTIARGRRAAVDVGEVNGRVFINTSSLGVYPRLVVEREREERKGRSYVVSLAFAAVRIWRHYRRVQVALDVDGVRRLIRTPFVFVGNNEYQLEGIELGARTRLDGGGLHVCMAPGMSRTGVVRMVLAALAGRLERVDGFQSLLTERCTVDTWRRHVMVSLDGEIARLRPPLAYRIRPGSLGVIVPA